jgi:hypothetical protein
MDAQPMSLSRSVGSFVLLLALLSTASAELIKNPQFSVDAANVLSSPGYLGDDNPPTITNWVTTATGNARFGLNGPNVVFANKYVMGPTDSGGNSFAFIENGTGIGSLQQVLSSLRASTTYEISWMAASKAGDIGAGQFSIGDGVNFFFDQLFAPTNASFTTYSGTFTTPATLNTPFVQLRNLTPNTTIAYTNVSVLSAVPEPSSMILIGAVMGTGSVAYRFRNRRKSKRDSAQP